MHTRGAARSIADVCSLTPTLQSDCACASSSAAAAYKDRRRGGNRQCSFFLRLGHCKRAKPSLKSGEDIRSVSLSTMNSCGQPIAVKDIMIVLLLVVAILYSSDAKSTARPTLCHYHASTGDCSFYHCLDVKLSCLRHTFEHRLAHRFCHRMHAHFDEFTPEGKHWADRTNKCVMRQLSRETASMDACRDVSSVVRQAFHTCAAKEDICSALWDNRQPLLDIMTEKSWLSIVQAAKHCPRRVVSRFIFWTLENLNV